ncbi:MAG: hypothetical protein HOK28_12655 [Deltaproteobacteria bacterium]|jgi:hypothetical protein|nr:hypothetical protein [Deltaproteobacteria bacterium]
MKTNNRNVRSKSSMRVIEKLTIHGDPVSFRELCERTVSPQTDYLVLDVDHTTHLHRNLGELLGWEICAQNAYGQEALDKLNSERAPGRLLLLRDKPLDSLKYLLRAAKSWAIPGLFYFVWAKWLNRLKSTRPLAYLRFGLEPTQGIQAVPQHRLLEQLSSIPLTKLRHMADRVWKRHEDDQVIKREDLVWLRNRCPGLTIILSSASPQPVLEAAARNLDVDHIFYTRVEEHEGFLSHPASSYGAVSKIPRRISPLKNQEVNSRTNKISALEKQFPEIFKASTHTVGMTDTGYCEDHCWANHFDVVVDMNSTDPFPPIIESTSPCEHIHSAEVLSRKEQRSRDTENSDFRDPRRPSLAPSKAQQFLDSDLERILNPYLEKVNQLSLAFDKRQNSLAPQLLSEENSLVSAQAALERIVQEFNCTVGPDKKRVFSAFRKHTRIAKQVSSRMTKKLRPLSLLNCKISNVLEEARLAVHCPQV